MEHFHSKAKGCEMEEKDHVYNMSKGRTFARHYYYCHTHKLKVCKCGWEIGWHYGEKADVPEQKIIMGKPMTEEEKNLAISLIGKISPTKIAEKLNRPQSAIYRILKKNNLKGLNEHKKKIKEEKETEYSQIAFNS